MGIVRFFKSQFIKSQTRRDQYSGPTWWKLPDDPTRRTSAWRQLVVDLYAHAPFSEWHYKVTKDRVALYDRLRPQIARSLFLTVIIVALAALGTPWWLMAATLWAAVLQVGLEIALQPYALDPDAKSRLSWVNEMTEMVRENQPNKLLNRTGEIGAVACLLNIAAVTLSPAGGDLGWLKVAALAAAIFYLNSGLASMFLDPPNYTENSKMPPFMHWTRPVSPVLSVIVVATVVAGSVAYGRWEPAMVPVAFMCALLTLLLGSTIRNHDRLLSAAIPTAREAITCGREDMALVSHTEMNRIKPPLKELRAVKGIPLPLLAQLNSIPAMVTHLHARAGINASGTPVPLEDLAEKTLDDYEVAKEAEVTYNITWGELEPKPQYVAEQVLASLCLNVAQALAKDEFEGFPSEITIKGYTTGAGRGLTYTLEVQDHLPLIKDWCPPGRSLTTLRTMLREHYRGDLRQDRRPAGVKAIVATWSDRTPEIVPGKVFK